MNLRSWLFPADLPLSTSAILITFCGIFPMGVQAQNPTPKVHTEAALVGCEGGTTRHRRAKLYTSPELQSQKDVFKAHFKFDPDGPSGPKTPQEITETRISIPWAELLAAEAVVEGVVKNPVRGIYIHYGMAGNKFKPVFQFLYPDDTQRGDLKLYSDKYFHVDGADGKLKGISLVDCKKYIDDYAATVNVMREENATPSAIDPTQDPIAEWFSYPDNVNALYSHNNGPKLIDAQLVVNCISEELCDSETVGITPGKPQFRHLLALNIADANTDLLDIYPATMSSLYKGMAMDLGHLCPPSCPK